MLRYASMILFLFSVACGPQHTESFDSTLDAKKAGKFNVTSGAEHRQAGFPLTPDDALTPGILCQHPDAIRYPEKIKYCDRSVSSSTKNKVIRTYDQQLGFDVGDMDRDDFKIDHLIPLCMGGDNDTSNLWPQHKSLYGETDEIELQLCVLLARGSVTQDEAVEKILRAKHFIAEASAMLEEIKDML